MIPVIFFRNPQLFEALNFCCFFKTHTLTHTGKARKVPDRARQEISCLALYFLPHLPHLLADDTADGVRRVLFHLRRGVSIGVQREPCRVVAQRAGQRFHVYPAF